MIYRRSSQHWNCPHRWPSLGQSLECTLAIEFPSESVPSPTTLEPKVAATYYSLWNILNPYSLGSYVYYQLHCLWSWISNISLEKSMMRQMLWGVGLVQNKSLFVSWVRSSENFTIWRMDSKGISTNISVQCFLVLEIAPSVTLILSCWNFNSLFLWAPMGDLKFEVVLNGNQLPPQISISQMSTWHQPIKMNFQQAKERNSRRKFRSLTSDNMDSWKSSAARKVRKERRSTGAKC